MKGSCLSVLRPGEYGVVSSLSGENGIKRRLQDLGLVEGTKVLCLQRSPLGDPTAFSIRGAVIALREEDSSNIFIK
ncbi:FeoA family protein [Congzhengia sp.]|uniref:FeoA family protein n=1 Tax=Congzhengia sp. TaxID=2944168 RepID=UPI003076EEA1